MEIEIGNSHTATLHDLIDLAQWEEAVEYYRRLPDAAAKAHRATNIYHAIALVRVGKIKSGISILSEVDTVEPEIPLLQRDVLKPLIKAKRHEDAIAVLDKIIACEPNSTNNLRLRASLYGRDRNFEAALHDLRCVVGLSPRDWVAHASLLKILAQADRLEEAVEHIKELPHSVVSDHHLAEMILLILRRAGRDDEALAWLQAVEHRSIADAEMATLVVKGYFNLGMVQRAEETGERFLLRGIASDKLFAAVAKAMLKSEDQSPPRLGRIAKLLSDANVAQGNDVDLLRALGLVLLRAGRESEAVPVLENAVKLAPNVDSTRALYARALRGAEHFEAAAQQYQKLLPSHPESHNFHRYAAGALSLAGKKDEAAQLFANFVNARQAKVPDNFEEGFDALWEKAKDFHIPAKRLEFGWKLRGDKSIDRAEWEHRAKWGYLADQFIIDWIECRDDQIHEAMRKLADLSGAERAFRKVDSSKGMILASAHIGPMFAGPLALELIGIESRWLASTPGSITTAYGQRLISTSDQTGAEVARQTFRTLKEGKAAVIAVDGAISLSAPRVPFEGQFITLSAFAPRLAHRLGVPTIFVAPKWEHGRISFVIEPLPDPAEGEPADAHSARWQEAFLTKLRSCLAGEPENLRLAGGIWRHLTLPDADQS